MPDRAPQQRGDPVDRLLRSTRSRLVLVTFVLISALLVGIGTVTAVAGLFALDGDVDRALQAAVEAAAANPPSGANGEGPEVDDVVPAAADTFILYVDAGGSVVSNPSRVRLVGLPDAAGLGAVSRGDPADWRTVASGTVSIRLLTVPIAPSAEGGTARFVQGGFVLTLHDLQSRSLVATIVGTGIVGLLAAAIVATLLTQRALHPIRQAMASQRRFVADASHELRTPAAIIRADAEVLEREGHVGPDGMALVQDIVDESARLGRLVGDLLTLATAERGELQLRREACDLTELTLATARRMEALAAVRGVTIQAHGTGRCGVEGDRDRLVQVIVVLLDNAIGHAPAGTPVEVTIERDRRDVIVAVRDHGHGVPSAERARIFQPFTRSTAAGVERRRGAGLGLAIAREITTAHGGRLDVEDPPGGGARFVLRLPAA